MKIKILLSLSLFLFHLVAFAQKGSIQGSIYFNDSQLVKGLNVQLLKTSFSTQSDTSGHFQLSGIPVGKYTIQVSGAHIKTLQKTLQLKSNETLQLPLYVDANITNLDEIVVSAGRTPEKLSEIPASVTIVGLQKLTNLAQATSNINEILQYTVPGLAQSTGSFSNAGQGLRGRGMLVMLDGVPQSTPLRNGSVDMRSINPNDLARVEVIKGATAIYGNGSSGGVINYITKKATTEKRISGSSLLWGTGSFNHADQMAGAGIYQSLQGKLNKFNYFVSGSFEKTGNRYDAKGLPIFPVYGLDQTKIWSGFAKLSYQIAANQNISFRSNVYQTRQDSRFKAQFAKLNVLNAKGDYDLQHAIGIPGKAQGQPPGVYTLNNQLEYELNDIFNHTTHFTVDAYQQSAESIFFYSPTFVGGGQSVIHSNKIGLRPNFNTKFNISSAQSASLTYGLDVLRDKTNQGLLDGRIWVPNVVLFNIAPYMQFNYKIKELWSVKLGARFDNMNFNVKDYATLPKVEREGAVPSESIPVKGGILFFNNIAFNAGVRYIAHKEFVPFVNYSQGFSMPDMGRVLRDAATNDVKDIKLNPIVTNNYEFGFSSDFPHVHFETVGYYSSSKYGVSLTYNDQTRRFESPQNPQRIFGGEAAIDFSFLNNQLQFGSNFSYVEGIQFKADNPYQLTYLSGLIINPIKISNYVTYQINSNWSATLRILYSGARRRFAPKATTKNDVTTYTYGSGEVPVTPYTTVDLQSSYQFHKRWRLGLSVNNLFNKFYIPPASLSNSAFTNQGFAGEGVNAKLSLAFQF